MLNIEKLTKTEVIGKYKELQQEYNDLEQRYDDLSDCYAELENQLCEDSEEDIRVDAEENILGEFLWELETNTCYQKEIFKETVKVIEDSGVRFEILNEQVDAKDIDFEEWMADRIYKVIERQVEAFQFGRGLQRNN